MDRDLTVGFGMPPIGLDKLSLCINADTLSECKSVKVVYNGVEHTYDTAKLKDALIWILKPYEIHENPSYECMRRAREESKEQLLEMRRCDVAQRLKALKLGLGSHENLSAIASVIYKPSFDWTLGACDYLRNQLVELIGGERASDAQCGCACGTGGCDCRHESEEVGDGIPGSDCGVRKVRHDSDLRDMGDCHISEAVIVTYDVLDNERHKAVCELRKLDLHSNSVTNNQMAIANALGVNFDGGELFSDAMRHRLIRLLGGDLIVRYPENYNLDSEHDIQNDENGDIRESSHMTITSELREYAMTRISPNQGMLESIADRIDWQFARVCEQQEQVLQDTIDHMQDEIDEHKEQRRVLARDCLDYTDECWNLYDLLRDAARDYRELYDFAKSIEEKVGEQEFVTLFGVDYAPYSHVEYLGNTLSKVTGKWAKADADCRMYQEMLNDAAMEYKSLQEKLNLVFGMWMSATGGGE